MILLSAHFPFSSKNQRMAYENSAKEKEKKLYIRFSLIRDEMMKLLHSCGSSGKKLPNVSIIDRRSSNDYFFFFSPPFKRGRSISNEQNPFQYPRIQASRQRKKKKKKKNHIKNWFIRWQNFVVQS